MIFFSHFRWLCFINTVLSLFVEKNAGTGKTGKTQNNLFVKLVAWSSSKFLIMENHQISLPYPCATRSLAKSVKYTKTFTPLGKFVVEFQLPLKCPKWDILFSHCDFASSGRILLFLYANTPTKYTHTHIYMYNINTRTYTLTYTLTDYVPRVSSASWNASTQSLA